MSIEEYIRDAQIVNISHVYIYIFIYIIYMCVRVLECKITKTSLVFVLSINQHSQRKKKSMVIAMTQALK